MSAFVRVILDRSIRRELDYAVPETLADKVVVGSRVRVPFRDKSLLATVVATLDESPAEGIKPILALLGEKPALSASLIELARWMANYYCCPIETVMRSLLPQVIRQSGGRLEETALRESGAHRDRGGDRKTAKARSTPGGVTGGDRATRRADAGRGSPAPDFAR